MFSLLQEEEGLVPAEKPDQNEKAVEMNNFSKKDEVEEEPLLTLEAQPVDEEAPDGQLDHVYAKVDKSKKNRNVSEDSNDPIGVAEPRTRLYSGLTRAEVIRMAKKSDASRDEAKQYLTPEGSRENLADQEDTPTIMYTPINQEELDEELRQFRSFFAQRQSKKFASTSTPAVSRTTTTVTTTTVVKTKKNVVENGTDDVFENGIEGSSPEEPSSPKEPRGPTPPGVEQIQTNVRQETHVEETVTTSVVVRASDLHALELLAASEDGAETKTDETGVTPSQDDQPAPSRTEGQDFSLFLDDDDLMEAPPPLPTTKYDGDAVVEDDFTSTIYEKDENVPDLDILEAVNDQESPDLTTVTEISTVTVTTVEKGTDDSKEVSY